VVTKNVTTKIYGDQKHGNQNLWQLKPMVTKNLMIKNLATETCGDQNFGNRNMWQLNFWQLNSCGD
jgi:hypothetical protein